MNVEEISYRIGVSANVNPSISKFENDDQTEIYGISEVQKAGIQIPIWTIRGVLDMTSTTDLKTFAALVKHTKTKGVKQLTGIDTSKSPINYINYYDDYYADQSKTANAVVDYIYVRIINFECTHSANTNMMRYTLTLRETS